MRKLLNLLKSANLVKEVREYKAGVVIENEKIERQRIEAAEIINKSECLLQTCVEKANQTATNLMNIRHDVAKKIKTEVESSGGGSLARKESFSFNGWGSGAKPFSSPPASSRRNHS